MATILLLEDDPALREELASYLLELGYRVVEADTLAAFAPLIYEADLAIVDLVLPDGDGFEAVSRLRARRPMAGAIILTGRGSLGDKVRGLNGGADHYLVKPVCLDELTATLNALLRRVAPGWSLHLGERRLSSPEGHACVLSPMEMILLDRISTQPPGEPLTRRALAEALGCDWRDYDMRRLEKLVSRLRQRWEAETGQPLPLRTVHRLGYSFGADLHRI